MKNKRLRGYYREKIIKCIKENLKMSGIMGLKLNFILMVINMKRNLKRVYYVLKKFSPWRMNC